MIKQFDSLKSTVGKKEKYDTVILDPSSSELNRGGFGYYPYILYNYLKEKGKSVYLIEDFSMTDFDNIPKCDDLYVSVWSYPQIDTALMFHTFSRDTEPKYFGYTPMIKHYGLPHFELNSEIIEIGILAYPKYYNDFRHILLCDCDLHLTKLNKPERNNVVYPLFDSFGCGNGCKFCPTTVNNPHPVNPSVENLLDVIRKAHEEADVHNIHFTGENLFRSPRRAFEILDGIRKMDLDMYFICRATIPSTLRFIEKYGTDIIEASGMKLIEVGFEACTEEMQKNMGKNFNVGKNEALGKAAKNKEFNIFWLTMTFFPGDCAANLAATGQFMRKYGYDWDDVCPRIATNSTVGGLGQYFQPYHGTSGYQLDSVYQVGRLLTHRPMRLRPSFLPYSFLHEEIKQVRDWTEEDRKWLALYSIVGIDERFPEDYTTVEDALRIEMGVMNPNTVLNWEHDWITVLAVKYALGARLGILQSKM